MVPALSRLKNGSPESLSLLEDQVVFNFLRGPPSLASEGADFLTETNATFFAVDTDFVFGSRKGLLIAALLFSAADSVSGFMDELVLPTLLPSAGEGPLGGLSSFVPFPSPQSFTPMSLLFLIDSQELLLSPMKHMNSSLEWFAGTISRLSSSSRHGSGIW